MNPQKILHQPTGKRGRPCTICTHPRYREITREIMARVPMKTIQERFGISRSALDRHIELHVSAALVLAATAERSQAFADAEFLVRPVLEEMRSLNARSLAILVSAEREKDRSVALAAIRECRRNLELIAKLTGELDPRAAGETPGAPLQVTVVYADKAAIALGNAPGSPVSLGTQQSLTGSPGAIAGHSTQIEGNVSVAEREGACQR